MFGNITRLVRLRSLSLVLRDVTENHAIEQEHIVAIHDDVDELRTLRSLLLVLRVLEALLESSGNLATLTLRLGLVPREVSRPLLTNTHTTITTVDEGCELLRVQTLRATLCIHRTDLLRSHGHFVFPFVVCFSLMLAWR